MILYNEIEPYPVQWMRNLCAADGRVSKLRAIGNAIVPQVAATFIRGVMQCL